MVNHLAEPGNQEVRLGCKTWILSKALSSAATLGGLRVGGRTERRWAGGSSWPGKVSMPLLPLLTRHFQPHTWRGTANKTFPCRGA